MRSRNAMICDLPYECLMISFLVFASLPNEVGLRDVLLFTLPPSQTPFAVCNVALHCKRQEMGWERRDVMRDVSNLNLDFGYSDLE